MKIIKETSFILKSFGWFLLHPNDRKEEKKSVFGYVIAFIIVTICGYIVQFGLLFLLTQFGLQPMSRTAPPIDIAPWKMILIGMLLAPVMEEFIFRYPLKYSRNGLFIGVLLLTVMGLFLSRTAVSEGAVSATKLMIWLPVTAAVFLLTRSGKINSFLKLFWNKYLAVIVYVMAAWFAIVHFTLPWEGINFLYLPVVVFSQLVFALYLSFLRLKVSFVYCILLHTAFNLLGIFGYL